MSVVVSKLRRMLGEAGLDPATTLASAFGSYRLHLPDNAWVDWHVAVDAVDRAERAAQAGDIKTAIATAKEAGEIARRGFLTDDCPWVDAQRERLRDLHVRAMHAQTRAHLAAGEHARAVITSRDALAVNELREASYRLLMEALAAAGERAEALRVWERCRVMLADELGVDPAPETENLYLSILGETPASTSVTLPSGVVTFLLTDIVDSSALWDRNPAAMAIALERHDRLVAETVGGLSGTVLKAKLEGDATVSVFPRASAAALAALSLRDALAAEPWPDGASIQVRMALHTGEAIERDGDYFGPALNRAARLRALAGAGQILVTQTVADVVRDHLPDDTTLTSLGDHQLRGLTREEHVFQLGPRVSVDGNEQSALDRPALPAVVAERGPFVGRRSELNGLASEWANATAGSARAMLIAGEPGVGKSRLAAEWARRAYDEGALVLYGRCDEELGAPYQPFAEALHALLPHVGASRLRSVRGIEQLARLTPELSDYLPGPTAPAGADPDTERSLLFDVVARLFATVSSELPVLVIIDDLHWAAKPTLLLLRHLLRAGKGTRLLVVGTYRSTDLTRSHPLAGVLADLHRDGTAERLMLGGLDADDVGAYLRAAGHLDARLGHTLAAVTSGNPFFLIELLRHVEETGGSWDPSTLPQGVREAVDRRLSRVSELANEALLVGAVAGSQFPLDLIEQVLERDLVDPIDEARRAGLVVEEAGNRFRFYHALVRQSLLAECVSVKRIRLHQRIAAALEADPSAAGEAHLSDLARHYFECAYAGGAAKAVEYSRQSGEQAMARLAYEEAADLYARALHAADVDGSGCGDDDRAELLVARCEALLAAGDPAAAAGVVDQLARAAHHSPRLSGWATCFAGQLAVLIHPERLETTVAEVSAAGDAFARLGDSEGEAKAHTVAASCLARLGRFADCEAALDRALVAARLAGNPRRVNAVLSFAPLAALWGPSPVPQASGRCLDVVRVLRITTGSAAVEAAALRCQAVLEAVRGRFEAARRMLGSARRSLELLGHTHGLLETDVSSGMVELSAGQAADAEVLLRRAYDGFSARGVGADAAQAAAMLARALLGQGRIEEALACSADGERLAGVDLKAGMEWRTARAEALARKGQVAEALDLARSAVALVEPTDALLDRASAHMSLAVVLRAAGDEPGVEREARRAVEVCERKGATALVGAAQQILGSRPRASAMPASGPVTHRRVRPNAASSIWERVSRLFDSGDIEGWADCFAVDFVDVDHMSHVTNDRASFVGSAPRYATGHIGTDLELVASLGERHALTRYVYHYEEASLVEPANRTGPLVWDQLLVQSVDTSGRICRDERFKLDDLLPALARLIELHADDELPPERRQERYAIAAALRAFEPNFHDDAVAIDHRPASLEPMLGRDTLTRASAESLSNLSADARQRVSDVLGFTERIMLLEGVTDGHDEEGGYFQIRLFSVSQFDEDGLLRQVDFYGPEQIDEALGQFDELAAADWAAVQADPGAMPITRRRVRPNQAFASFEHSAQLIESGDIDGYAACIPDDFVEVDHISHVTTDREALVSAARESLTGHLVGARELLASLGERQALRRCTYHLQGGSIVERANRTGPLEFDYLQLEAVDARGRQVWLERFKPDDLLLALANLIELHADNELPPDRREERYTIAAQIRDGRPRGSEDAVSTDHRPVSDKTLRGPDALTRVFAGRPLGADVRLHATDVLGLTEREVLLEVAIAGHDEEGGPLQIALLALNQYGEDGLLQRADWYGQEQIYEALAAFDELTRDADVGPLSNKATRQRERLRQALLRGDWDALAAITDEGVVLDDRRAIVGHLAEGRDAYLGYARSTLESGVTRLSSVPVAIRGERLALTRTSAGGPRTEVASLSTEEISEDGLYLRTVVFDPDDLDAAFAELDERYLTGEGAPHAEVLRPLFEITRAHNRQDWARVRELVSDNFQLVDHRAGPNVLGEIDGPDQFIAVTRSRFELARSVRGWLLAVQSVDAGGVVLLSQMTTTTSDGAETDLLLHLVATVEGGKITRLEHFPFGQFDAAEVRLRALSPSTRSPARPRRVRPNAAARIAENRSRRINMGNFSWAAERSEDFVDVDHVSHVTTDRETQIRAVRKFAALDQVASAAELLATLGERHALLRTTFRYTAGALVEPANRLGPVESVWLQLNRSNTKGQESRVERFKADDLYLAVARLIELHADDELPPERRQERYAIATQYREQRSRWSEDALLIDHRPANLGVVQGPEAISRTRAVMRGLSPDYRSRVTDILGLTERVTLTEVETTGHNDEGGSLHWRLVTINQYGADGLLHQTEVYSADQIDDAFRRFDELSESEGGTTEVLTPQRRVRRNAALAKSERTLRLWETGDVEGWAASSAQNFVMVNHAFHVTVDRETFIHTARTYAAAEPGTIEWEPLATLGVRHELSRLTNRFQAGAISGRAHRTGPLAFDALQIVECDTTGQVARLERFKADDIRLALARLIELHAESELPPERLQERYTIAGLFRDHRVEWGDDAVLVDHRPASLGTVQGSDAIRRAIAALRDLGIYEPWHVTDVFAFTERLVLVEFASEVQNEEGGPVQFRTVDLQQYDDAGHLARCELFRPEQLDEAFRRFDELMDDTGPMSVAPEPPGVPRPAGRRQVRPNTATTYVQSSTRLANVGDVDAWAATFSEDLVYVDHILHVNTDGAALLKDAIGDSPRFAEMTIDVELLASLGERHALTRSRRRYNEAALLENASETGPLEFFELHLERVDAAGRATRIERFNGADLHQALGRLVELHAEEELPPGRQAERSTIADQLREQCFRQNDDAVFVDHRSATRVGAGSAPATTDLPGRVIDVLAFTEEFILIELAPEDGTSQDPVLALYQFGDDGLVHRSDRYGRDQADEALTGFEVLMSSANDDFLQNDAARHSARMLRAELAGEWGTVTGMIAESAVLDDRRTIVGLHVEGREAVLRYLQSGFDAGVTRIVESPIATRGDRLVLNRVAAGSRLTDLTMLTLDGVSPDGQLEFTVIFDADDADAAFEELDARFAAGDGAAFDWASEAASGMAYNRRDWPAFEATLAEDVRHVDHRRALFGEQDRAHLVQATRSLFELVPDAKVRILAVPRLTRAGLVCVYERTGHDETGALVSWRDVSVNLKEHGLTQRFESFPIDDLPSALARFEELTHPNDPESAQDEGESEDTGT